MREMLADVLAQMPEFEVVAQAADFDSAVRQATASQPEVIILDWLFPGGGGLAFLRAMRVHRLTGHVLVLSGNTTEASVGEALTNGARGFFEKGGNLEEFFRALRTVAAGGAYFGPLVASIVGQMVEAKQTAPARPTREEVEVAEAGIGADEFVAVAQPQI